MPLRTTTEESLAIPQLRLLVKRTMIDKDHGSLKGYLLVLCCLLGNFLPGFPLP